jgi:lipoprotein-releasing system ATP-binding protein
MDADRSTQGGVEKMSTPLLRVQHLKKIYKTGKQDLVLFNDLSFELGEGEMLAIIGESGTGKSTLLHILGALDTATAGEVWFGATPIHQLTRDEQRAADFRGRELGYVWQFHYLLPEFSALENVAMPLFMRHETQSSARSKALEWLKTVGLKERAEHRPGELSGGEQQRVALARALITGPKLLLADEPTGDLDLKTGEMVFALIHDLHRRLGLSSIIVTHNPGFAERCDRVLRLSGGNLISG